MCLQEEDDAVPTAWCQASLSFHASNRTKPWWNVDDEHIGFVRGVTYWSSRLNVWVIDLTMEDDEVSGSISGIMNRCGSKAGYALNWIVQ
ncbi:unnamed protein product [Phytophthora fragariaefolia]|uniref:Unnamed protein product n=1 Tax=Phytophthora fragariaefolia TaxID=1490495 RepID=A0A9W6XMS3_9STRA|nr:unnamed protein product [Phytophthora fragariaefolia]